MSPVTAAYDHIADKVLHLCEPGDGVCDNITANINTGYVHSYAYRGKDVFPRGGQEDSRDYRNYRNIFPDREPDASAANPWRSDWSMWTDVRVRGWLEART